MATVMLVAANKAALPPVIVSTEGDVASVKAAGVAVAAAVIPSAVRAAAAVVEAVPPDAIGNAVVSAIDVKTAAPAALTEAPLTPPAPLPNVTPPVP